MRWRCIARGRASRRRRSRGIWGVYPATLLAWIREAGQGAGPSRGGPGGEEAAVSPVEAENRALRRRVAELEEEREILRRAAKYFAGETNW